MAVALSVPAIDVEESAIGATPMQRFADAEEIAAMIACLCSDLSTVPRARLETRGG